MAAMLLYAVDLDDMRRWVGCGDETLIREGLAILREDEEADWEPEELKLLERLLRRMVMDGRLYEGLEGEERYYLTQLLIDLFDEMAESEAVSEDLPHAEVDAALAPLRAGGAAASSAAWVTRGRLFGSDELVWDGRAELDEILPYFGTLSRDEIPILVAALEGADSAPMPRRGGRRGADKSEARLLAAVRDGARAARESERDLLIFVA